MGGESSEEVSECHIQKFFRVANEGFKVGEGARGVLELLGTRPEQDL